MKTTPREFLQEGEIGWLAGIIDGEGSLSFSRHGGGYRTEPRVSSQPKLTWGLHIVNTNMELMTKCHNIMERLCGENNIVKIMPKKYKVWNFIEARMPRNGRKTCYQMTIRKQKQLTPILKAILPYLTEKKERVETLLEYFSKHKLRQWNTEEDLLMFDKFCKKPVETKRIGSHWPKKVG